MICSVIDRVHTNGIDTKLLEFWNVSFAAVLVGNWVSYLRGPAWLIVKTTNVEAVVASEERCGER